MAGAKALVLVNSRALARLGSLPPCATCSMAASGVVHLREFGEAALARGGAACCAVLRLRIRLTARCAPPALTRLSVSRRRTRRKCTCCPAPSRCAHACRAAVLRRVCALTCVFVASALQRTGAAPVSQYFYPQDTGTRTATPQSACLCARAGARRLTRIRFRAVLVARRRAARGRHARSGGHLPRAPAARRRAHAAARLPRRAAERFVCTLVPAFCLR
jgi:hypothetical protein